MSHDQTIIGLMGPEIKISDHDSRKGQVFGKVTLEGLIARGGMADIYRGRHSDLDRLVAVKIPKQREEDSVVIARMRAEAKSQFDLKRICGKGILSILDVGETPEPHIIMEYVDNSITLDQLILDNPNGLFDPKYLLQVLEIMRESFTVVWKAHEKGIIHRDIKPANILVVIDKSVVEEVYAIDWGLVKKPGQNLQLTSIVSNIGSPFFMAPEQGAKNKLVGPKADVFAAAATLFAAVMGELLFKPKDPDTKIEDLSEFEMVWLFKEFWDDKYIQERIKVCPAWLQPILAPALKIDIDERCTMAEFIELIEGGINVLKRKMEKSCNATVETPVLTKEALREITGEKKKRSFGSKATWLLCGILAAISGAVALFIAFGGSNEPEHKNMGTKPKDVGIRKSTMRVEVQEPTRKRLRVRPKPSRHWPKLGPPRKGHLMPSNEYIEKLFKLESELCLKSGYRRDTYDKSPTNHLGCMRKRIRKLYYSKHYAAAILLLDQTIPNFCFYISMQYDTNMRDECERAKQDKKHYFKPVSGIQMSIYDKRLTRRIPIRNRIRRERKAWYIQKYYKKKPKK
ncbi:serine/threonine-protein kinase [Patescibacteria group bacterium]